MKMDEARELAAQGVVGKRVDEMETGFMMALDYMIQLAVNDEDEKRMVVLEVIKETALSHLTKKCPPHTMESRPVIPDRRLLARLLLIREEARNMMGGGILDERNDCGLSTLPEPEVNFLTKLVALKPGKTVQEMIKNVMLGKNEGADHSENDEKDAAGGITGRPSMSGRRPNPVWPGMFVVTVSKVLGGFWHYCTALVMGSPKDAPNFTRNSLLNGPAANVRDG